MRKSLTVKELLDHKGETLSLELLTDSRGLGRMVAEPEISSPGLALAGYRERMPVGRLQVFGETEMTYLANLGEERASEVLDALMSVEIPAVFITKAQSVPQSFLEIATRRGVPVLRSKLRTAEFYRRIKPYLEEFFAPTTTMHASLADVCGIGLLFVGRSGIGKSECVLDLVERGHRLVADDVVIITQRGNDVLIGRGHELQRHHMEIRGIGIIDVRALFGIRAIRQQKRIEVVVQLEDWNNPTYFDRTGLVSEEVKVLGVTLPKVVIPLNPGKNITVMCEVVAMNHLLKVAGVDAARAFDRRLMDAMRPGREYLEEDYE
ncbi:MAG: HPr(Ser) kinase/phosphatase [Gemmatimonadetes bacterium]|nr:HPr(Ser) kinase/phosphatase [Gemmatimonadota bacterium]